MFILNNPIKSPFNEWLSTSGLYIAIAVAGLLLIVVITLLILNKKKDRK